MVTGLLTSTYLSLLGFMVAMAAGVGKVDVMPAGDPLLPMFDESADQEHVITHFADIEPGERIAGHLYFDAPIPKKIHQIWFGDPRKMCDEAPARWRQLARKFKYEYHLWSESDDVALASLMPKESFELMVRLRAGGSYRSASDMVRMSILEREGGIYSDVDIGPPMRDDAVVDLAQLIPMRGLVMLTENFARNVGNSAVFFANGFIASSPNQPVVRHLVRQMPINLRHRLPEVLQHKGPLPKDERQEAHHTGPFLLNRSLAGVMTVLPITFARRFDMVRDRKWDVNNPLPPTYDEMLGEKTWSCATPEP